MVTLERREGTLEELVGDEDDVAVAAITVAELLLGVELSTGRRRKRRQDHVSGLLEVVAVESYDIDIARSHAKLLAWVRGTGSPRVAHDLIIAATAVARSREVVTTDASGFAGLPGVSVRSL